MLWFDVELIVLTTKSSLVNLITPLWFDVELIVLTTFRRNLSYSLSAGNTLISRQSM